ncbi:hypothetical protein OG988_24395 [Streptomyces zaomyceticus]|uniref:hypothetical protein n=1 Tax=Streptomyces zaomyceticus TaxID=68286 RepID=UPI00324884C0
MPPDGSGRPATAGLFGAAPGTADAPDAVPETDPTGRTGNGSAELAGSPGRVPAGPEGDPPGRADAVPAGPSGETCRVPDGPGSGGPVRTAGAGDTGAGPEPVDGPVVAPPTAAADCPGRVPEDPDG